MSRRQKNLSQSAATIIAAIIGFVGIIVAGLLAIRAAERPTELAISATQTAISSLLLSPTPGSIPTQIPAPNNSIAKIVGVEILQPHQGDTHPLFRGEYEFTIYSPNPIIVEFVVTDVLKNPVDIQQVFVIPEKGVDLILYSPDYNHKDFPISPVNKNSSLNNRYFARIGIPRSGSEFLEGEYTLEIKPNPQYISPAYQFDEKSYLVRFFVKNTLDTERISKEFSVLFTIVMIVSIILLYPHINRFLSKSSSKHS